VVTILNPVQKVILMRASNLLLAKSLKRRMRRRSKLLRESGMSIISELKNACLNVM
jgi:hypothetical protein